LISETLVKGLLHSGRSQSDAEQIRTPVVGSLDVEVQAAKPDCRSSGSMPDYGGWPQMG